MTDNTRLLAAAALFGLGLAFALRPSSTARQATKPASRNALARQFSTYNWDRLVGDDFDSQVQAIESRWTSAAASQHIDSLHSIRQEIVELRALHLASDRQSKPIDENALRNLVYFRDAATRLRAVLDGLAALTPDLNLHELALRFSNAKFIAADDCDLKAKAHEAVAGVSFDTAAVFESASDLREIDEGVGQARKLIASSAVSTPFEGGLELAAVARYLKECVQAA